MAKSKEYWKKRFEELETASNSYGREAFHQIEPVFNKALREIERDINDWYARLAKNNKVSIQEARKLLNAKELKEFKWDVNEYIKYGRENGLNHLWMKELENASAKVHISRLEALKIRTQQAAETAFGNELDAVDMMARKVFTKDYYHTIFELQKGFEIAWNIGQIDERKLEKLIVKPWAADGKNFSDRIWESRTQLISELHNQLTRTCTLGKAPTDAINAISKKFNTSKSQAGRLVMTEQAYFHSVAQQEAFNELDVEKFEIIATLDTSTSAICREMDGKVFLMKDYLVGVTAPPFHPWCRTVTAPFFEDDIDSMRAMRNKDGKTEYVPANMKYEEWYKKYVLNEETQLSDTKEVKGSFNAKTIDILEKEFGKLSTDKVILKEERIEHIKEGHPEVVEIVKKHAKDIIESPDYILKDALRKETILCIKKLEENSNINVVIKLALENSNDKKRNKNSIITSFLMNDKRLERELKKKVCIYNNIE